MSEETTEQAVEPVVETTTKKKEAPTLRTLSISTKTKSKKSIDTVICVTEGKDPNSDELILVVFTEPDVNAQLNYLNIILKDIEDSLNKKGVTPQEINMLTTRKIFINAEKDKLINLLECDYIKFTASWKNPDLKDLVEIENRSMLEDGMGKRVFNDFENIKAKLDLLLLKWNVTDVDEDGSPYLVPTKEALDVDPEILKTFSRELDNKFKNYTVERKK